MYHHLSCYFHSMSECFWFLGRLTQRSISHSAKLRPKDVLRASPTDVLMTSPYGPLCNGKKRPLPTSLGRPLLTSLGGWNMTSWGRPHTVLYIMPWNVPYRRLKDVSCRGSEASPYDLIFNSKTSVLTTFWGCLWETSWGHLKDVLIWFYK